MDIYQRFATLPRARRGTTTVVIVDERVLEALIIDAQASEADFFKRPLRHHVAEGPANHHPLTTISGGATNGAPMQIHVDPPVADMSATLAAAEAAIARLRRGRGRSW